MRKSFDFYLRPLYIPDSGAFERDQVGKLLQDAVTSVPPEEEARVPDEFLSSSRRTVRDVRAD